MTTRAWTVAAALLTFALLSGCGGKSSKSSPSPSGLTVVASRTSVLANGTNTVDLQVAGAASGPVAISTNRGTFSGGGQFSSIPGTAGTVTLVTCDAASAGCAGTATVTATDGSLTSATASVAFVGLEACAANCNFDPACANHTCTRVGGTGTCSAASPSVCAAPTCVATEPSGETSCGDGVDNDCDGLVDCADSDCNGRQCLSGSPTFLCQGGLCKDAASGAAIAVAAASTRLPADGAATTQITVTVTQGGSPASGVGVTLSTDLGTLSAATATTGADGKAAVTFTASATAGPATIRASLTAIPVVSQSVVVTMPALGAITLPVGGVQYSVMGVAGSGYREIDTITVALTDDKGLAYPAGLAVRFEHQALAGSHLSTPAAADTATCVSPTCVGFEGVTDASGLARVNLYSGRVAGTLAVAVTASAGGADLNFTVPAVAVIGARASGANFSIVCSPRNVPALAETDCSTSLVDAHFTCVALLKDRFNNLLGTSTQVTFVAEAAAVGQVATTPAYDPTKTPAQQSNLGTATQIFNTLGAGLPFDVPPATGEPSVVHGLDGCGARTHNPRDGALTVIAIADGEEAFFDANGNGVYDAGEPFIDLGEPFVDQNDNGQYDAGEWFLDVNQNGKYDGPNGVWDASTKLWTETVVVYTGVPAGPLDAAPASGFLGSRWADGSFAGSCTPSAAPAAFSVKAPVTGPPAVPATSQDYVVVASDLNLNQLATSTTYSVATESPGKVVASYHGLASYADDLGFFFQYWPCDQTGACASQCRATGTSLPCLMKPAISTYSCGIAAGVTLTGAAPADGANVVDWRVSTTYPVLNSTKTLIFVDKLAGTNN